MHVFCFTGLHSFPFHSAFALNFLSVAQNNSTLSFLPNILSLFLFTLPLSLSIFCIPLHVHNVLCYMPLSFATQITLSFITYIHFISLLLALAPKSFTEDSITPHFLQFCICICLCLHIVSLSCLHCQYLFVNMDQDKKERLSRLQMVSLSVNSCVYAAIISPILISFINNRKIWEPPGVNTSLPQIAGR